MDNNINDDDFLGESIDEIFNNQFDGKKKKSGVVDDSKGKNEENKYDEAQIVDNDFEIEEKNLDDEGDIYVLEDPGIEVIPIKDPPVVQIEDTNKPLVNKDNSASFDLEDDFELLEKEFDSVKDIKEVSVVNEIEAKEPKENLHNDFELNIIDNKKNNIGNDEDPLDLESEFVNLQPPEKTKNMNDDLDEFELESHHYNESDKVIENGLNYAENPPPIPSISKDGSDYNMVKEDDFVLDNSSLDSFNEINDTPDNVKTDGRFFNSDGKPINDDEILQEKKPSVLNVNIDDQGPVNQQPFKKPLKDHNFNFTVKENKSLLEKKNLFIIAGSIIIISIIAALVFILPGFFDKSDSDKIIKTKSLIKTYKSVVKKKENKKKKINEQEKINNLFLLSKKKLEEGKLDEAKELCRQAINIKRTDVLIFLEREINDKIDFEIKKKKSETLAIKDENLYNTAIAKDSVAAFEKYIEKFPNGMYYESARSMVRKLTKRDYEKRLLQIIEKAGTLKKIRLREQLKNIGKNIIQKISESRQIHNDFEIRIMEGDTILIDYSTGLMWIAAKYKMKLDKARFWSVRHYAGYYNWRLPTSEEIFSLKGINPSMLKRNSLDGYRVWTGDGDSNSSGNWIFSIIDGKFYTSNVFENQNLLAVRTIK